MSSKKGVIEVQFNWIFILIAGALIIAFFVVLIQRQGTVSEETRNVDMKSKLNSIFSGAKHSTGTYYIINIPKAEIKFTCSGYSVGGTSPFQLGESFSPSKIKSASNTIMLWSQDFNLPYKVSNIQYLISPDVKYVIVDTNQNNINAITALLPTNITVVTLNELSKIQSDLKDTKNYQVRFITIATDPTSFSLPNYLKLMPNVDVTALQITPTYQPTGTPLDGHGTVDFYQKDNGGNLVLTGNSKYAKEELVKGAIFTDSKEAYDCVLARILTQFNATSQVYLAKSDRLFGIYKPLPVTVYSSECTQQAQYSMASTRIQNMIQSSSNPSNLPAIYGEAYTNPQNLRLNNYNLMKASCPLIY